MRACIETGGSQIVTPDDALWADAWVVYSNGGASEKQIIHQSYDLLVAQGKKYAILIAIANVPDVWMGQIGGMFGALWHVEPELFERAVFFNIDVFPPSPVSYPIRNATGNITFAGFAQNPALAVYPGCRVNVDCNLLVAYMGVIEKHVNIPNRPELVGPDGAIVQILKALP